MNIGTMDFKGLVYAVITNILEPLTVIIMSLAVVYFLWTIAEVIRKSDNPEELGKLKTKAMWGIVGIAVMVSLWGLVRMLTNTFVGGAGMPLFNQGHGNSLFQINVGGGRSNTSGGSGGSIPVVPAAPSGGNLPIIEGTPVPGGGQSFQLMR